MSKERELLIRAKSTLDIEYSEDLINDINELLAQPEQDPLSDDEIQDALIRCRQSTTWDYGFETGVKYAEKAHGIGVDDES